MLVRVSVKLSGDVETSMAERMEPLSLWLAGGREEGGRRQAGRTVYVGRAVETSKVGGMREEEGRQKNAQGRGEEREEIGRQRSAG